MKKWKLILAAGLTAVMMILGAWVPTASQVETPETSIASGDVKQDSIPTILPPL